MARPTKDDKRIERLYGANFSGVQIPLMSIPKVFGVGRAAIAAGQDDAGVVAAMTGFINTVAVNRTAALCGPDGEDIPPGATVTRLVVA